LLAEVSLGSWDGLTPFEIDMEYPDSLDGTSAFDWFFRAPDGEGLDRACKRARTWLARIDRPTIAVSHALFGRLVRGAYLQLAIADRLRLPTPQGVLCLLHGGQETLSGAGG